MLVVVSGALEEGARIVTKKEKEGSTAGEDGRESKMVKCPDCDIDMIFKNNEEQICVVCNKPIGESNGQEQKSIKPSSPN